MGMVENLRNMGNIKKATQNFVQAASDEIEHIQPIEDKCDECCECRIRSQAVTEHIRNYFKRFL